MTKKSVATFAFSVAFSAVFLGASPAISAPISQFVTVNGVKVDRYTWKDSQNRKRTVSLKREGEGNPGHGGYAVQMTYQTMIGGVLKTITANAANTNDGGFGYFVSHERYRSFVGGGATNTIARKIFQTDDSPLSLRFPVVGRKVVLANPKAVAHRFKLNYPRYGTINPIEKGPDGNDKTPTPINKAAFKLYNLPVTVTWIFQDGTDYPRIQTDVSLANVPGPDRVNFDLRGPYGVMVFDNSADRVLNRAIWGDRFHFRTLGGSLTRQSAWHWKEPNNGARYTALIAGNFEMGLVEPKTYATSSWVDGYSDGRGKTSATYHGGNGCNANQLLPCDWEWPYQSAQYSLPPAGTTTFKKLAWGSAPFWGTGPSLTRVYDTPNSFNDFKGFPGTRLLSYNVCLVLGTTSATGLTRTVAAGPKYNCANTPLP